MGKIAVTVECSEIITSLHALKRMAMREVSDIDVKSVLRSGEIINEYPDDKPYASKLVFLMIEGRAIHVVVGRDNKTRRCIIVTVYIADEEQWRPDFKTKRK